MRAKKPNFLVFITDQQRADHLGCAGNETVKTPNIDAIAARGVRFENFYVSSAICQANRATFMTGRMPSLHKVRHNGIALSREDTNFVELLQADGYRTALVGKAHLQNMTGSAREFEPPVFPDRTPPPEALSEASHHHRAGPGYEDENSLSWLNDPDHDISLPFYGFDEVTLCTMHGDRVQGHYTNWLRDRLENADDRRTPKVTLPDNRYSAPQAHRTEIPEELYPTTYVADQTIDWLERYAGGGGDAPFLLQCSFPDPHHPYTPPGRYWDMYDPDDITLPASFHDSPRDQIPPLEYVHAAFAADPALNREQFRPFAANEREAREIIALTYGMIAMIDDAIGRIIARLDALGLAEDTVILFMSDHGDWMGDHGVFLKAPLHFQGVVRVPMIIADPAAPDHGRVSPALSGTIDLARTILDRAGLAPFNGIQGQNLNDIIYGRTDSGHPSMLIEQQTQRPYMGLTEKVSVRTLVTNRWRLSLWQGMDWGELYDLENDPGEYRNLWAEDGAKPARAELMEMLARRMVDFEDSSPWETSEA